MKRLKELWEHLLRLAFFPFVLLRETWKKKQGLLTKAISSLILMPLLLIWGLGYLGCGALAIGVMANTGLGFDLVGKSSFPTPSPSTLPTINQQKLMEEINSWEVKQGYKPYVENGTLCYITDERLAELTKDWNTPKNYSKYDTRGEFSNITENVSKGYTPESTIVQNWLNQYNTKKNLTDYFEDSCVRCSESICVQLLGNLKRENTTTIAQPVAQTTIDPDPIVSCNIHASCGGGTRQMKKSACDQSYCCFYSSNCGGGAVLTTKVACESSICCQVGNGWSIYPSKEKCILAQQSNTADVTKNTGEVTIYPPCTIYYSILNKTETYYNDVSPEECQKWRDQANALAVPFQPIITPIPTTDPAIAEQQRLADIQRCKDSAKSKYDYEATILRNQYRAAGALSSSDYGLASQKLQSDYQYWLYLCDNAY